MKEFSTLLVGSAMLAVCCLTAWFIGALMGWAAARVTSRAGGKHQDVDQLLATQRTAARNARPAAAVAPPGATSAS